MLPGGFPTTANPGWTCPRCGTSYAPWVYKCPCVPTVTRPTCSTEGDFFGRDAQPLGIITTYTPSKHLTAEDIMAAVRKIEQHG